MKKKKNPSDKALENSESAMTKPIEVALEKKKTVLRSRAKKLSQEIESKETGEEYFEVLEFLLEPFFSVGI